MLQRVAKFNERIILLTIALFAVTLYCVKIVKRMVSTKLLVHNKFLLVYVKDKHKLYTYTM